MIFIMHKSKEEKIKEKAHMLYEIAKEMKACFEADEYEEETLKRRKHHYEEDDYEDEEDYEPVSRTRKRARRY